MWRGGVLFVVLVGAASAASVQDAPQAETPLGKISGYYLASRAKRTFAAFTKIPFAQPPVKNLRFQPPEPIGKWDGIYNATQDLPTCMQSSPLHRWGVDGVEDCLYLSVFTHNVSGKVPVLVHIHGGAFCLGGNDPAGQKYLMDEDVVVVFVSYRVGILGFMSFENELLPGNQGMKDQVEALRWVKRNIASFGGDPDLITIIGESAGGACVFHHTISLLSKGLFHRAIAESGTSYATWTVAPPGYAKSRAKELLGHLNCTTDDLKIGLDCALNKSGVDIVSQFPKLFLWGGEPMYQFGPVLEKPGPNAFLVGPINEWKHEPVPLLMGITSAEGLMKTLGYVNQNWTKYTEEFNKTNPIRTGYFASASNPDEVTNQIRQYYLNSYPNLTLKDWVNLTAIITDMAFLVPAIEGANKHDGDVFFYYFDYILKDLTPTLDERQIFGAVHTAESALIWKGTGKDRDDFLYRKEDIDLSIKFVKIVTNFARFGTPVQNGSPELPTWDKWTESDHNYMNISKAGFQLKKGLHEERYNFWKSVNYRDNYDKDSTGNSVSRICTSMYLLIVMALIQFLLKK